MAFDRGMHRNVLTGVDNYDGKVEVYDYDRDGIRYDLSIWDDGTMCGTLSRFQATDSYPPYQSPPIFATRVVRVLDSLGIALGE